MNLKYTSMQTFIVLSDIFIVLNLIRKNEKLFCKKKIFKQNIKLSQIDFLTEPNVHILDLSHCN